MKSWTLIIVMAFVMFRAWGEAVEVITPCPGVTASIYAFTNTVQTEVGYFDQTVSGFTRQELVSLKVPPSDLDAVNELPASYMYQDIEPGGTLIYSGEISSKSILFSYSLDEPNIEHDMTIFRGSWSLGLQTGILCREVKKVLVSGSWITEINRTTHFNSSFNATPVAVGVGKYRDNQSRVAVNCTAINLKVNLVGKRPSRAGAVLRVYVEAFPIGTEERCLIGKGETSSWGQKPVVKISLPRTGVFNRLTFRFEEMFQNGTPPAQ